MHFGTDCLIRREWNDSKKIEIEDETPVLPWNALNMKNIKKKRRKGENIHTGGLIPIPRLFFNCTLYSPIETP